MSGCDYLSFRKFMINNTDYDHNEDGNTINYVVKRGHNNACV